MFCPIFHCCVEKTSDSFVFRSLDFNKKSVNVWNYETENLENTRQLGERFQHLSTTEKEMLTVICIKTPYYRCTDTGISPITD